MLTRWMQGLVVGLAALFLAPAVSQAAADDQPGNPYVVIVGIDKFGDSQILPRKHAESDAQTFYDLFTNKDNLGADPKNVKLLLGSADAKRPHKIATKENILEALTWLEKTAGKDDLVLFVFIGQGAPLGERSCYFATDSTFKDRNKNAVASGDIENHLDKLLSQRFVAFVDVNFLGFKTEGGEKAPEPNLTNFYREYLGNEEAKNSTPSRAVFLPNTGLKPSIETEKGGLFTQVLVDGLQGKADTDGYEPDGNITIDELVKYFRKQMVDRAREMKKLTDERGQSPVVFDFHMSDFIIDHNPAAYPKAKERLEKLAEVKDLPKEFQEEGQHLLSRMPKLESQQELRKAYQKLADAKIGLDEFKKERDTVLASTQLPARDAESFAKYVMSATRMVRTGYVKAVTQPSMVENAIKGMYKHLNEKMPSALEEKVADSKNLTEPDLFKLLIEARTQLGKREDLSKGKDVTAAINGMLEKLDRHTGYIDPETVRGFDTSTSGEFSGIGVQIRKNNLRDQLQVVTPIYGSPAYRAKVYADDIITNIIREVDSEGKPLEKPDVIPTKGMTTEQAVEKILGKAGTKVKIVVEPRRRVEAARVQPHPRQDRGRIRAWPQAEHRRFVELRHRSGKQNLLRPPHAVLEEHRRRARRS